MSAPQQPSASGARPYYSYSLPLIFTLVGTFVGLWLIILPIASVTSGAVPVIAGRIGTCLFIGCLVTTAWLDWRGLVSMRGLIDWSKIHGGGRIALGCVLVLVIEFVLGIYLARAAYMALRTRPSGQTASHVAPFPGAGSVTERLRTPAAGFAVLGIVFVFAFVLYSFGNLGATPTGQPPTASQNNAGTGNQGTQNTVAVISSTATSTATIARLLPYQPERQPTRHAPTPATPGATTSAQVP